MTFLLVGEIDPRPGLIRRGSISAELDQRVGLAAGSRQPPPRRIRPVSEVAGETVAGIGFMFAMSLP